VGYHQDCQVTTGRCNQYGMYQSVDDPDQIIDQVFCAALNVRQGPSGKTNSNSRHIISKSKFVLDSAYQGTYLAACFNKKRHLVLTLIGGGAFGNEKKWIYEAMLNAHMLWANNPASCLEKVTLVLFSQKDIYENFTTMLKEKRVPFKWFEYVDEERTLKDAFA